MPKINNKLKKKEVSSSDSSSSEEEESGSEYVPSETTPDSSSASSISLSEMSEEEKDEYRRKNLIQMFKKLDTIIEKNKKEFLYPYTQQHTSSPTSKKSKSVDSDGEDYGGGYAAANKKRKYGSGGCDKEDKYSTSSKSSKKLSVIAARKHPRKTKRAKIHPEYSDLDDEISPSDLEYMEKSSPIHDEKSESEEESEDIHSPEHQKFRIVLNLGDTADMESICEEYPKEADDNEECGSEDEATFMKEKYVKMDIELSDAGKTAKSSSPQNEILENGEVEKEYLELLELKKTFIDQLKTKPKNKILLNSLKKCNSNIRDLIKKTRHTNTKLYHSLVSQEKTQNKNTQLVEMDYFKKKLSNTEQIRIMQELRQINQHMYIDKPYRLSILQSNIPPKYKAIAIQKLNTMSTMTPGDNEYFKIKNWVDAFMRIPFGIHKELSISIKDGVDTCHSFIENAKQQLDDCVYGLNDAKMQIMQMIGQWLVNPSSLGTSIAIHGPPGTGKTSIVKDGISKILGREFAFIALGGGGDSTFLEGHSYTYEGSTWGKIAQILMDSKCMNPVIYFDELDKISDTARGQEIIGILTHLTDTTQNSQFHDKYFSEIQFDISKCLFIFSYNEENLVNPILRDRLYRIRTKGYDAKDKLIIAKKYLLPKIREQVAFTENEIIIPDDVINYIINSQHLTQGESGVRNLKRCLEIIHTKLNLFRVVKPDNNLLDSFINMKVTFPYTVTKKDLDILIKRDEQVNQTLLSMYI